MPINREPRTPPPMIGKIGPYTVFVTPPATPKPDSESPKKKKDSPPSPQPVQTPPPVQPPPQQYHYKSSSNPAALKSPSNGSPLCFFWNAVAKVQNAHSSLDDYVAHWFGLNQSKYQWALDDYYEGKGADQVDGKAKVVTSKIQSV